MILAPSAVAVGLNVASPLPATAQTTTSPPTLYTFERFDVPGATETAAFGINDAGDTVGFILDTTGGGVHGFLRTPGGGVTIIDGPFVPSGCTTVPGQINSFATEARGINNAGATVGFFGCAHGGTHGYLLVGGAFTQIDVPGTPSNTVAEGVNNRQQIVGAGGGAFIDTNGSFITFDIPGSQSTDASGINDLSEVVGTWSDASSGANHAYFRAADGTITSFDVPGSSGQGLGSAGGVNNAGQISGSFSVGPEQITHGYVRFTNGTFSQLDVPGAALTIAAGINNRGQITGIFQEADGRGDHGYVATPVFAGEPGKPNCHGQTVSSLARKYGGLNRAAASLGFSSVQALQSAIMAFCGE